MLGVVAHAFNPNSCRQRQADFCELQSSQSCTVITYVKKKKEGYIIKD